MLSELDLEKAKLRKKIKKIRLSEEYIKKSSDLIYNKLILDEAYIKAKTIFIYVSMKDEIDTHRIIRQALLDGKLVGVPLCHYNDEGDRYMTVHRIESLKDLKRGNFGILEPSPNAKIIAKDKIDLAIVPCLSADRQANRLGHGGGYYDRYLEGTKFYKILLCRKKLLEDRLPISKKDIRCDRLITD